VQRARLQRAGQQVDQHRAVHHDGRAAVPRLGLGRVGARQPPAVRPGDAGRALQGRLCPDPVADAEGVQRLQPVGCHGQAGAAVLQRRGAFPHGHVPPAALQGDPGGQAADPGADHHCACHRRMIPQRAY